jgi:hypothetical protein
MWSSFSDDSKKLDDKKSLSENMPEMLVWQLAQRDSQQKQKKLKNNNYLAATLKEGASQGISATPAE